MTIPQNVLVPDGSGGWYKVWDETTASGEEDTQKAQADAGSPQQGGYLPPAGKALPNAPGYREFSNKTGRHLRPGVATFSVATDDRVADTRNFRTGSDVQYRTVFWFATRAWAWPEFPPVDEADGPLISSNWVPREPILGPDNGTWWYIIEGSYTYVFNTPDTPYDPMVLGRQPFSATADARRVVIADSVDIGPRLGDDNG